MTEVNIISVARMLGLNVRKDGTSTYCSCPVQSHEHDDKRPRCQLGGRKPHLWFCHKCSARGDVVDLVAAVRRCDKAQAFEWLRQSGFLSRNDAGCDKRIERDFVRELAGRRGWTQEGLAALGAVPQMQDSAPPEVRFPMRDANGETTGWRRRRADGTPFGEEGSGPKCLSTKGSKNGLICPWPLPDADPVLVTEGEADAAAALSQVPDLAVVATPGANPGAACTEQLAKLLADRTVILAPDPDDAGAGWQDRIGLALMYANCRVRVLPQDSKTGASAKQDLDERLSSGADLQQLLETATDFQRQGAQPTTIAQRLLRLLDDVEFFRTHDRSIWAELPSGRAVQASARKSLFRDWLCKRYVEEFGRPARGGDISDVLEAELGRAQFAAKNREVYVRLAGHGGHIYLDLGSEDTRAVEITPDGWQLVERPPLHFAATPALAALTEPAVDAKPKDLEALIDLLALTPEDALRVTGWLLGCLQPDRPFPILLLMGPAGSGKSMRTRLLRSIIDPAGVDGSLVTPPPREGRDLFAIASGVHVLALDNLSSVPPWLSDFLSGIATGTGQANRKLYTDHELEIVQVRKPIVMNGIDISGLRADLLDRTIVISCQPIEELQAERHLLDRTREVAPRILGALLEAAAVALKNLGTTHIPAEKRPRMLDFALWVKAAEPFLQQVDAWRDLDVLELYAASRRGTSDDMLGSDLVGNLVNDLLTATARWEGTASDLLGVLETSLERECGSAKANRLMASRQWPSGPPAMGKRLKRLVPHLKAVGILVQPPSGHSNGRIWVLQRKEQS
jgi:5S rRNA maturation endonuclease (ribonuclease M5)